MQADPETPFTRPNALARSNTFVTGGLGQLYLHDPGTPRFPLGRDSPSGEPCIYETEKAINDQNQNPGDTQLPKAIRKVLTPKGSKAYHECIASGVGEDPARATHGHAGKCYICGVTINNPASYYGDDNGGECEHIIPFLLLLLIGGTNSDAYRNKRDAFWATNEDALAITCPAMTSATYKQIQEDLWSSAYLWSCTPCNKFKSNYPFINIVLKYGYKLTVPEAPLYPISTNLQDHLLSLMCNNSAMKPKAWRSLYRDDAERIWNEERVLRGMQPDSGGRADEVNTRLFLDRRLRESIENMQPFVDKIRSLPNDFSALTLIIARHAILKSTNSNDIGATIGAMINHALTSIGDPSLSGGGDRSDDRKKNFKKGIDGADSRRSRGETRITVRKEKRDEALARKRRDGEEETVGMDEVDSLSLLANIANAVGADPGAATEIIQGLKDDIIKALVRGDDMDAIIGALLLTKASAAATGNSIIEMKIYELYQIWVGSGKTLSKMPRAKSDEDLRAQLLMYLRYEGDILDHDADGDPEWNPDLFGISTDIINNSICNPAVDAWIDPAKQQASFQSQDDEAYQTNMITQLLQGAAGAEGWRVEELIEEGEGTVVGSMANTVDIYMDAPFVMHDYDLAEKGDADAIVRRDDMYTALNCYNSRGIQYAVDWYTWAGKSAAISTGNIDLKQDLDRDLSETVASHQVPDFTMMNVARICKIYLKLGVTLSSVIELFPTPVQTNLISVGSNKPDCLKMAVEGAMKEGWVGGPGDENLLASIMEGGAPKCQPCSTNKVYKPPKSSRKKSIKKKKSKKKTKKKYIKKSPKYSTKKSLKKKSFKKGSRKKTLRRKSKRKSKK